jgi:Domain of unknown function (DUF4337)
MAEIHEVVEHIEHAAHASHGAEHSAGSLSKQIGLTMAVLGVLLAFCSALVGASRTELIAQMVERGHVEAKHQTLSTKACMFEANLVQLHALQPDPKLLAANRKRIDALGADLVKDPNASRLHQVLELQVQQVLTTVTPTPAVMARLVGQMRNLQKLAEAARAWAHSYEGAIVAHSQAAEHYELSQLCVEIAIVVCSVALLLSNRTLWVIAMLLGVVCMGNLYHTHHAAGQALSQATTKIESSRQSYEALASSLRRDEESTLQAIEAPRVR